MVRLVDEVTRRAGGAPTPPARVVENRAGSIFERVLAAAAASERALVAIDGIGASRKSTFAASLAEHAGSRPVVVLHTDDFFNPAHIRHARGRLSARGFWLDTYNYDALVSWALAPLSRDGTGLYRTASFDRATGTTIRPDLAEAPEDALVIVEGAFLHRDELARHWDYTIYLDVSFEEANRRMRRRGGLDAEIEAGLVRRYNGAQRLYFDHAKPWERASLVVDNTDPANPAIIDPASAHAAR